MPHDPADYGAAPPPGRPSTNPYGRPGPRGVGRRRATPSDGGSRPVADGATPTGDVEAMRAAADAAPFTSAPPSAPAAPPRWAPVATADDHSHPRAAVGYGRYASPSSWHSLRPRVGALLHGLVRIGRWASALLLVAFVVGVVLHSRLSTWETEVPLDGTPVSIDTERGAELWVWLPEGEPAARCEAADGDGLDVRPYVLTRHLTNDDHDSVLGVPTGSGGALSLACEPSEDAVVPAPDRSDTAQVGPAPSSAHLSATLTLMQVTVRVGPWVLAGTAVLWIAWGVLRAMRVLPRLRA